MPSTPSSPIRIAVTAAVLMLGGTTAAHAALDPTGSDASMTRGTTGGGLDARYTRTLGADGRYRISTRFSSFDGHALQLGFSLAADAGRTAAQRFGVSRTELDALVESCVRGGSCTQATLDRHLTRYYRDRGLRVRQADGRPARLYVDVPLAVHRNRQHVQPVAAALRRLASEQGHDLQWAIEAAVALVQTGLPYRQPGEWEDGRKIVGFYPPARALEQGFGDCDTKSALLASILLHLTDDRLVGVRVPQHYLLGIAARPRPGQAHIRHEGQTYVLVEAAGPAMRRPGEVADATLAALRAGDDIRIDPI